MSAVETSESVQIVLEAFDAVEHRDRARLLELYHPEVEFHWPPQLPYGGSFRGDARPSGPSWSEVWDPLQPTEAERRMDPRVVAASEEEVVVLWRQLGVSPSGERFEGEVLGLYGVREGKFARAQMFYFDTAAVSRFLDNAGASARQPVASAVGSSLSVSGIERFTEARATLTRDGGATARPTPSHPARSHV